MVMIIENFIYSHIASPVIINPKDVKNDLLNPAIQGTVGILKSALNSSRIKSVVITSSLASVFDLKQGWRPGYTYTAVIIPFSLPIATLELREVYL